MLMAVSWQPSENLLTNKFMTMRFKQHVGSVLILSSAFIISACSAMQEDFTLTNNSEIDRSDEPIVLSREAIIDKTGGIQITEGKLPLPVVGEQPLPAQVDDIDGDGEWDELAFTLTIAAGESKTVSIEYREPGDYPEFTQRTNVRFGVVGDNGIEGLESLDIPANELPAPPFSRFQMDGPAWENDKVGFRQYIDGRNGRDLYGKKLSSMALDTVGISAENMPVDDYHVMLPWGRDILAVGNSLGLGGIGIIEDNTPVRLGVRIDAEENNVGMTSYNLITEGPVRSVFSLTYEDWDTGNQSYDLENTVTIWAGSYSYKNDITLNSTNVADTLTIGVVNIHNDEEPVILEKDENPLSAFYTHDKQTYDDEWYLGMGIIFPSAHFISYQEAPESGPGITNSYLNLFELVDQKSFSYHVVAGWELSDERFADAEYFKSFMEEEVQKISTPITVE